MAIQVRSSLPAHRSDLDTMLRVAEALGAYDEIALLRRARGADADARMSRDARADWLAPAMAMALLKRLRLLGVTNGGPRYVGELPFPMVRSAIDDCGLLEVHLGGPAGHPLRAWVDRTGLRPWTIDAEAWWRRLRAARDAARPLAAAAAALACEWRTVVAERRAEVPMGPHDGSDALELIFDDGSAALLALPNDAPTRSLLGCAVAGADGEGSWRLMPVRGRRTVSLRVAGALLQPSPLAALRQLAS